MDNILKASRINELKSYAILDDASNSNLEQLTQLIASICQTPIATITLLDEGLGYFEYAFGLDIQVNNQSSIFYDCTVRSKKLFVILDTEQDSRFVSSAQIGDKSCIKFYVGVPLISKNGTVLGVLSIQDYDSRALSSLQRDTLETLAGQMVLQLEFCRQRYQQEQLALEVNLLKLDAFQQSTKLKETQRISHIGSWELKVKDNLLIWSDETYQIFGITKSAFNQSFEEFLSFVHPHDLPVLLARQNEAMQGKRPLDFVYRINRPNGELRFVHERAELTLDIDGKTDLLYGSVQDVTEQKIREITLAQNEAIVRATFAAANAGIAMAKLDGTFVIANPAYCKMIGYDEAEICNLDFIALTHPDDRQRNVEQINRLLKGEFESFIIEKKSFKKNGDTVWLRDNISLIRANDGNPTNIITVTEDITSEKLVEEELQKTQSLLEIAGQISRMGGWTITLPDWKLTWSNEVAVIHDEPIGYSPSLNEGINYYTEECRESIEKAVQACAREGIAYDLELQILTRKGRAVSVRTIGQAVRDTQGNIVGLQGAYQDITARKKAEQEKQEALTRMQRIASRLPGMIYELRQRPDGSVCMPYVSDAIRNIFRLAPEDVFANAALAFSRIHPDDLDSVKASLQTSATNLSPWIREFRLLFENGEVTWVSGSALPQLEVDGSVLWHGFTTDITESRKSQEQLELLEVCISRLTDIILITEANPSNAPGPKILFVNDAFVQRTGYSREEAIGQTPRILQGPKTQREELDRIHNALENWQPVRAELINYTKSGEEFWVELDIVPVADENGWYTHWIAVEREITERKQVELELSRLNRALLMYNSLTQSIIQATDENDLLNKACQLAVNIGGYCMSWVAYANNDSGKTIQPITAYGSAAEYVDGIKLSWSEDVPEGRGPAGQTIRSGTPFICEDITSAPCFSPWLETAEKFGLRGVVNLPLRDKKHTFGMLGLFLSEMRTLATDEVSLLQALADDLAFAIISLRSKEEQKRVQDAISKVAVSVSAHSDMSFFEQLNHSMAEALNADGAFIARLLPGLPLTARTISAISGGNTIANFDYLIADTPCENVLQQHEFVVAEQVAEKFPKSVLLSPFGSEAYVGRSLLNSAGQPIGIMYLLFKSRMNDLSFAISTLKIFSTRAASELERQAKDVQIRQQASLLDKAQDAIIVLDLNHSILFWNKSAERLYGWSAEVAMQKSNDQLLYDNPTEFYRVMDVLLQNGEWNGEIVQRHQNGSMLTVEGHWTLVRDENEMPQSIFAINTDVTARKIAQEKIQQLAFYDPLTMLPNRQLLIDRLKQTIASIARSNRNGALLFIDLDNFKTLNDTLGHDVGDLLLKAVADRLVSCVRKSDTVARLGGDEFVVMLTHLSNNLLECADQAKKVAEKILSFLNHAYHLNGHAHQSTPSIGVTLITKQSNSVEAILKQADLAMYQAKAAGRNTLRFYDTAMQSAVTNKVALEKNLKDGLLHHEFLLHYQPQLNSNKQIIGAEALIRWFNPERGMVSPAQFIPLAEETRLIIPIGQWVLETACKQLVSWGKNPETSDLVLSVNVSVHQFRQPDFVKQVMDILEQTSANPFRLKLELTESLLVDNVEDIIIKMVALKTKGVSFSLDDFGTGYSSLSNLKLLPLDQLKIDQSFVRDVMTDPNDASIACTIVALAQNLGLEVIAEGVETEDQHEFLFQNGCYFYQGYLFSKPLPIDQFDAYLRNANLKN